MHDEHKRLTHEEVQRRIREGIKAVLEQIMEEEMAEQLQARRRERTEHRRGERNGHYERGLTTEAGHIEQLRVPRAREGPFLTEVFERYRRLTGSLEEAVPTHRRWVERCTCRRLSHEIVYLHAQGRADHR